MLKHIVTLRLKTRKTCFVLDCFGFLCLDEKLLSR